MWDYSSFATDFGSRPIVSLKSNVQLKKQNDGTYKIVEDTEEKIWAKEHSLAVTITDEHSGLSEGASLQYGWSTSNTQEPSNWENATISGYTAGDEVATFTATGAGLTGKYYLWVKPVTAKDVAGNRVTDTKVSASTYWFDNTAPTITVTPTLAEATSSVDITITAAESGGSGFSTSNEYKYQMGRSNSEVPTGTWSTYQSGASRKVGANLSGEYYLWVKSISDIAGNTSTSNGTTVNTYHVFGPYIFDNILQSVIITGEATGVTNGLIRYYDGTNNTGKGHSSTTSVWKDLSGNYDATITDGTVNNNHVALNTQNSIVDGGRIEISDTNNFTIETSFMIKSGVSEVMIFGYGSRYNYVEYVNGGLSVYLGGAQLAFERNMIDVEKVYNLSITYENQTFKLYIDGVLYGEGSAYCGSNPLEMTWGRTI